MAAPLTVLGLYMRHLDKVQVLASIRSAVAVWSYTQLLYTVPAPQNMARMG